ncbi:MAG: RNA methyltransferase [Chloroflexota bacterium]
MQRRRTKKTAASKHDARADTLALVKQLRQLRSRSGREQTQTYYIEGARIVAQAIQAGADITLGVIAPELVTGEHGQQTITALRGTGAPIAELDADAFNGISFKENLQGIGAVIRFRETALGEGVTTKNATGGWLALDNVGNPGNLGAIMRTCDAVGCSGLILLGDTVDPYHPAAVRASMGSLFALQIVRANFNEFVEWKHTHSAVVVGTTPDVQQEYRDVVYPNAYVLLMGSERLGLSIEQQHACDILVRIPMVGTCDSLNLGVATSIILYEAFHQQRQKQASQADVD